MSDLFGVYNKLKNCVGYIPFTENGVVTECVWFSNMKFENQSGCITIKDMTFADYIEARKVNNPNYISRIVDLLEVTPCDTLVRFKQGDTVVRKGGREVKKYRNFFNENIKKISKFDESDDDINEDLFEAILSDLRIKAVRTVCKKYNISSYYANKIWNDKTWAVFESSRNQHLHDKGKDLQGSLFVAHDKIRNDNIGQRGDSSR